MVFSDQSPQLPIFQENVRNIFLVQDALEHYTWLQ